MPAVRREVAAFDKDLPLADESTLEQAIGESIGQERFTMFVLGIFATVALLLAAVGVYGVIAYFVAQRSHEIGIRMALGAQRTNIVSLVTGRVLVTTGIGVAVGLVAAAAASGLMTKPYTTSPTDDDVCEAGDALIARVRGGHHADFARDARQSGDNDAGGLNYSRRLLSRVLHGFISVASSALAIAERHRGVRGEMDRRTPMLGRPPHSALRRCPADDSRRTTARAARGAPFA
jgi:hypothetical protein